MFQTGIATLLWLLTAGSAIAQPVPSNGERLPELLTERGFTAPTHFKALVGEIRVGARGRPTVQWLDWRGTSGDRDDWWPASSIKLYAAIAALERSRALGFPPNSWLTFHYEEQTEGAEPFRMRLADVVRQAIIPSDNASFNRLVELVGFDTINGAFFTAENGFTNTVFLRAYNATLRDPVTGHGVNRLSPRITVEHEGRELELPARRGRGDFECPDQGNCTTLRELAESMRRVMLHEALPAAERFDLGPPELSLLRQALEAEHPRHGTLLVEAARAGFGEDVPLRIYHKPGFANRWTSDVMLIHRTDTDQRWLLALAGMPGRRVLDEAVRQISTLLADGTLFRSGGPAAGRRHQLCLGLRGP